MNRSFHFDEETEQQNNLHFLDAMDLINSIAQNLGYTNGLEWAKIAAETGEISASDLTAFERSHRLRNDIAHGGATEICISAYRLQFVREYILPIIQQSAPKSAHTAQAEELFRKGIGYLKGSDGMIMDQTEAVRLFKEAAEQCYRDAQYMLGHCHRQGWGCKQNLTEAASWYRQAAEQGHSRAQWCLGDMYAKGQGVTPNVTQAVSLYHMAAEQGDVDALFQLGSKYLAGMTVYKNEEKGVALLSRAAELGSLNAIVTLKDHYHQIGNSDESLKWYRAECAWHEKQAEEAREQRKREIEKADPTVDSQVAYELEQLQPKINKLKRLIESYDELVAISNEDAKNTFNPFKRKQHLEAAEYNQKRGDQHRAELKKLEAERTKLKKKLKKSAHG